MAAPLPTGKQTVNLAARGVRVSKIRRDPPPPVKELEIKDVESDDTRTVILGILVFTVAVLVASLSLAHYLGWSPKQVTINWTE